MPSRPNSFDDPARNGEDRPVLPPIRDWFRDELSRSPFPPPHAHSSSPNHFADHSYSSYPFTQYRGMPGPSSSLPASPELLYSQFNPSSFDRTSSHSYLSSKPELSRSSPPIYPHVGQQGPHSQSFQHAGMQMLPPPDHLGMRQAYENGAPQVPPPDNVNYHPGRSSPSSKYECQYCGKGFNRPSSLKTHLNTHTGEKPFVCPNEGCGRAFSVQSNMRRHARVHSPLATRAGSDCSSEEADSPGSEGGSSSSKQTTTAH